MSKSASFCFPPKIRRNEKVGEKPHEIEVTPDGRTAFISNFGLLEVSHQVGTPGTTISVLDIVRGVERAKFRLPAGAAAPHGLKLRPPKYRELFANAEAGNQSMIVFDANSGRKVLSKDGPAIAWTASLTDRSEIPQRFETAGCLHPSRVEKKRGAASAVKVAIPTFVD